jgi:hypothetical protein
MTRNTESRISFAKLVESLPHGRYPAVNKHLEGVTLPTDAIAAFVSPTLVLAGGEVAGSKVLVLSAPAAAGKSTLAKELARETGSLLLDLAKWNVGNNFLPGTLWEAFGSDVGTILGAISSGHLGLIIDAVDETQLRSGENNFEQFLGDVADYLKESSSDSPSVAILGRAETAEYVALFLEDREIPFARVAIDYFDEVRAKEFIDAQLDAQMGPDGPHRVQRPDFERSRDLLWSTIATATAPGELVGRVDPFLGYPPVLVALAKFLTVDNMQALHNQVERIGAADRTAVSEPWDFILAIVRSILEREQSKIGDAIYTRLDVGAIEGGLDRGLLFAPAEQCVRVSDWVGNRSTGPDQIPDMPAPLREEYLALVSNAVSQHAFLGQGREYANIVFRDFVTATELLGADQGRAARARAHLRSAAELPTPLVGNFLLTMGQGRPFEGVDVGLIYESLAARETVPGEVRLFVTDGTPSDLVNVVVEQAGNTSTFIADCVHDGLSFPRRLRAAVLETEQPVRLGSTTGDFVLGPDVDIQTSILTIASRVVRVICSEEAPVQLEADIYDGPEAGLELKIIGGAAVMASWPGMAYPWIDHQAPPREGGDEDVLAQERLRHLSHILKYFVRHGRGPLGAGRQLIDNVAVGRSPAAAAVFRHLVGSGVVRLAGSAYEVDVEALGARGINYADLRSRRLTESLRIFLAGVEL